MRGTPHLINASRVGCVQVLLIRETRWGIWGSPYLDAYGEEDPELKRGRPLYLNRSAGEGRGQAGWRAGGLTGRESLS